MFKILSVEEKCLFFSKSTSEILRNVYLTSPYGLSAFAYGIERKSETLSSYLARIRKKKPIAKGLERNVQNDGKTQEVCMNVNVLYQNRHPSIRAEKYLRQHLNKLQPLIKRVHNASAEVIFQTDGTHNVQLRIDTPKPYRALVTASHQNLFAAMHIALTKLKRKLTKKKERFVSQKKGRTKAFDRLQDIPYSSTDAFDTPMVSELEAEVKSIVNAQPKPFISNQDIADILLETSIRLKIFGAEGPRIKLYEKTAQLVRNTKEPIESMVHEESDLRTETDICSSIVPRILQIVKTKEFRLLEELRTKTPDEAEMLLKIPGLGSKRLKLLFDELGINTIAELEDAAWQSKIKNIKGFGAKRENSILQQILDMKYSDNHLQHIARFDRVVGM